VLGSPAIAGDYVYFGSRDGNLYALDALAGKERWRFTTDLSIAATPTIHNGIIYIGGQNRIFYALE